jgi:hypothetical protein
MREFDYRGVIVTIDDNAKKPYAVNIGGKEFRTSAKHYATRFIDEKLHGNTLPKQNAKDAQGRRRNRA